MSYIRAKQVDINDNDDIGVLTAGVLGSPDLDMNLDDETLDFILALISKVNDLGEDQALVVWKEIF